MNDAPKCCGSCVHYVALYYRLRDEPPSYAPAGCGLCPLESTVRRADSATCAHFRVRAHA